MSGPPYNIKPVFDKNGVVDARDGFFRKACPIKCTTVRPITAKGKKYYIRHQFAESVRKKND
jgi:hypothetical protein